MKVYVILECETNRFISVAFSLKYTEKLVRQLNSFDTGDGKSFKYIEFRILI